MQKFDFVAIGLLRKAVVARYAAPHQTAQTCARVVLVAGKWATRRAVAQREIGHTGVGVGAVVHRYAVTALAFAAPALVLVRKILGWVKSCKPVAATSAKAAMFAVWMAPGVWQQKSAAAWAKRTKRTKRCGQLPY